MSPVVRPCAFKSCTRAVSASASQGKPVLFSITWVMPIWRKRWKPRGFISVSTTGPRQIFGVSGPSFGMKACAGKANAAPEAASSVRRLKVVIMRPSL